MSEDDKTTVFLLIVIIVAISIGAACFFGGWGRGESESSLKWQSEAIARGVAGYDEKTGEWKWAVERKVAE